MKSLFCLFQHFYLPKFRICTLFVPLIAMGAVGDALPVRGEGGAVRVAVMIGEDEYEMAATLPKFVEEEFSGAGFRFGFVHEDPEGSHRIPAFRRMLVNAIHWAAGRPVPAFPADRVFVGGRIVTVDAGERVAEALAIRGEYIVAVGGNEEIEAYIVPGTVVTKLDGKMVIPGLIETHCHAIGVARNELTQTYAALGSIAEIQEWIRREAREMPPPSFSSEETLEALAGVLRRYNEVGITGIFERATDRAGWRMFEASRERGELTVRANLTFRQQMKTAGEVRSFVSEVGLPPRAGDRWLRAGPLKITVDGGIHWGNTYLSEPYGERRAAFYAVEDPGYRGDVNYSIEEMTEVFGEAHRLGWQVSAHVTGDAGIERVLDALAASEAVAPARDMCFNFIHAYFPSPELARRAGELGAGVDTQTYLYYKDSDAIAEIYGTPWAERFMGLNEWLRAGVPVAINADHMIGLDPDTAMNAFNPFLHLYVAVTRKNDRGRVYGEHQRLSQMDALRTVTTHAAWLSFDETHKGSLEAGKLAEVVVLDRDYLTCPEEEIREIRPLLTMVGGEVVYEAK